VEESVIAYFRLLSEKYGLPYQTLINLYLRDCADKRMQPRFGWVRPSTSGERRL
jgi:hypothetical protein